MFNTILCILNSVIENPCLVEGKITDAKSYEPDLEIMKRENELSYMMEQQTKNFKILANDVISLVSEKFDCCYEFKDDEYTEAFKEYLESQSYINNLDYKLLFDVVDKIMINAKGDISIHFVNNTVLCHEKGEFVNAAC